MAQDPTTRIYTPPTPPVTDTQQIDVERLRKWVDDGQHMIHQVGELLDLACEDGLLDRVQQARQSMIGEHLISQASPSVAEEAEK